MKLIIASNNQHKIREIKEILGDYFQEIFSMRQAGISLEVEETGETFCENAILKAEQTLAAADGFDAAIADDSGLVVDALGGAPGVYSARYAGEAHDDEKNNTKLLRDMENVEDEQRTCRFVSAIALARCDCETICVSGACEGTLLRAPAGESGFGYDPLFYYAPNGKSFAQMTAEEKNEVSHRKRALEALQHQLAAEQESTR
ncbi:XTP/dITP diphosphatase [Christensenellaceae bacterium OttesenSCG-928-L17]|nr:XTP/dITP diphosphatase [Christensenellaceae bacterium OttesenSCG-928-L17]